MRGNLTPFVIPANAGIHFLLRYSLLAPMLSLGVGHSIFICLSPDTLLYPDSLLPDSLLPDSLLPDFLLPDSLLPDSLMS